MQHTQDWYRWEGQDLVIELKVQPRASCNEILLGRSGDRPRLRVTAPAVDDRANRKACEWLANAFGVARSRVVLEHGARARVKRFRIREPSQLPPALAIAAR